jgi:hypothetical protein
MKRVKVLVPFTDKVTGEVHAAETEVLLSEERIAEIKLVNINMVSVLGDAEAEEPKKPRARKKKEE